jgi:hypothetical protein
MTVVQKYGRLEAKANLKLERQQEKAAFAVVRGTNP